jgi:hypothetical protein
MRDLPVVSPSSSSFVFVFVFECIPSLLKTLAPAAAARAPQPRRHTTGVNLCLPVALRGDERWVTGGGRADSDYYRSRDS